MAKKRGPSEAVSDAWIALLHEKMQERDLDYAGVARLIGAPDQSVLTRLRATKRSRWANEIADALGMPRPLAYAGLSDEDQHWLELGRTIRAGNPDRYLRIVAKLERAAALTREILRAAKELDAGEGDEDL